MAPKRTAAPAATTGPVPAPSPPTMPSASSSSSAPAASSSSLLSSGPKTLTQNSSIYDIAHTVWQQYLATTPQRTMLLDAFMGFLVLVGGVQFVYCVVGGNYPFNAFLSGFCAAVGQFVLTASLRMQTSAATSSSSSTGGGGGGAKGKGGKKVVKGDAAEEGSGGVSAERAFADYVFGSLILHFFCINFIN